MEWRSTLVGFENHGGRTYLGDGVQPLGRVVAGFGNNGEDGGEGAVYRNVFGTYLHGSLLPKNPQFADHVIETALRRTHKDFRLGAIDDDDRARGARRRRAAGNAPKYHRLGGQQL